MVIAVLFSTSFGGITSGVGAGITLARLLSESVMNISVLSRCRTAAVLLVCTFMVTAWAAVSETRGADKNVTLSGCLIRGEGDDAGYLLANPPAEPWLNATDKHLMPSAVGTSGDYATIFYWLGGHGDLREHVGQRIEVEGELKGDVKDGEIKTERKDNWTEMTVKADGKTLKARVPNTSIFPASNRDKERKSDILVRRVDVDHVRMISAVCN